MAFRWEIAALCAVFIPVLWLISTIIFGVMHLLPGDPAELKLF